LGPFFFLPGGGGLYGVYVHVGSKSGLLSPSSLLFPESEFPVEIDPPYNLEDDINVLLQRRKGITFLFLQYLVTMSSLQFLLIVAGRSDDDDDDDDGDNSNATVGHRSRFITGCIDGKVRVWSMHSSKRMVESSVSASTALTTGSENAGQDGDINQDDTCTYMGTLPLPPNTISNEKIQSIQYHTITDANDDETSFIGILRSNTKHVDVYRIRSFSDTMKKKVRRLRRKREKHSVKQQKQKSEQEDNQSAGRGKKRGLLEDDDDEEENEDNGVDELLGAAGGGDDGQLGRNEDYIKASDEFEYIGTVRSSHKIKAFTFSPHKNRSGSIRLVLSLSTNALETHSITQSPKKDGEKQSTASEYDTNLISTLDMYGHPSGIRSIALSSDDTFACTVSKNVAKVWNVTNRSCIRSLTLSSSKIKSKKASFYGLCVTFLPGDTHFVLGTREGHLLIVDIASGDIVYFEEKAHEKEIWSIDLKNPKSNNSMLDNDENRSAITIMTGSADKSVKFWEIERQGNNTSDNDDDSDDDYDIDGESKFNQYQNHPMLVHVRTLQTTDDVVACRYSYDTTKRMVFVSTLDSQIKVFFDDTLKFFLSLYGHSLPALAIDASDDDTLLASGGADKSIKIWGLDFGDTHRTLYGHSDSITDLKFVKKTHNFFTCSKDTTVRYWDADRFEQILLLTGHSSEINCLSLSKTGAFVLSGGMDRQVRVWERTRDMVFLEEEKERELEAAFDNVDGKDDKGTEHILRSRGRNEGDDDDDNEGDENLPQSEAAVRRSVLSVSSGDRIMEALERADEELKEIALFNSSQKMKNAEDRTNRTPNFMLLGMQPSAYILWVLRGIKSTELEQSLLILPLSHIERLIYYLIVLLRKGQGVEICSRAAICLIKSHQNQIIFGGSGSSGRKNSDMSVPLRELRRLLKVRLGEARDTVGYNIAAMRMVIRVTNERKSQYHIPDRNEGPADIWKGLDRL